MRAGSASCAISARTYGVEVQFFQNEEFRYRRRFKTRALAVQWPTASGQQSRSKALPCVAALNRAARNTSLS